MKNLAKVLFAIIFMLALVGTGMNIRDARAQNPALTPSTLTIPATVSHTNCAVSSGNTVYCFAGDGLWVSLNGAPYVQAGTAPVTSVNGQTGAVVLAIPSKISIVSTGTLQ